jgi:hypothetical protein
MAEQKAMCINGNESYTVRQFIERTGLGASAVRHAEADGLRVVFVSRMKFIRGAAWLQFLESKEKVQGGAGRLRQRPHLNDEEEE